MSATEMIAPRKLTSNKIARITPASIWQIPHPVQDFSFRTRQFQQFSKLYIIATVMVYEWGLLQQALFITFAEEKMTKEERNAYMRDRHQRLKDDPTYKKSRAVYQKKYRDNNIDLYRSLEFAREMKKYSVSVEWYRDKLIEQGGLCAMCRHLNHSQRGELHRLQVDHDHSCCDLKTRPCGKCVRGLICEKCNLKLSYLELLLKDIYGMYEAREGSWTYNAMRYLTQYERLRSRLSV